MKLLEFIIKRTNAYKELEKMNTKLLKIVTTLENENKAIGAQLIMALTINQILNHNII